MEKIKPSNHGGPRPGAGRPQTTNRTVTITTRISPQAAEILNSQTNKSEYLDTLIISSSKA